MGKITTLFFGNQPGDQRGQQIVERAKDVVNKGTLAGRSVAATGAALPPSVRHRFETQLNQNLSDIRIHENHLPTLAGARVLAQGHHIHFAPGQYDPHSQQGAELLGHELAHVVQRRAGRVAIPNGMTEILDHAGLGKKS